MGITQRIVNVETYVERRDALDQHWAPFLHLCQVFPIPLPNRHPDLNRYVEALNLQGLILSGGEDVGNGAAPERDEAERLLMDESVKRGWPVIGVCRGMQFLNLFHGGRLRTIDGHVGCVHPIERVVGENEGRSFRFDGEVNSYHRLGVSRGDLADDLVPLVETGGWVEGFVHTRHPHYGIMWHPERNGTFSENDVALFKAVLHRQNPTA